MKNTDEPRLIQIYLKNQRINFLGTKGGPNLSRDKQISILKKARSKISEESSPAFNKFVNLTELRNHPKLGFIMEFPSFATRRIKFILEETG